MTQKPYLNAGAGRVILPSPKPAHYGLIPDAVTNYPLWLNVDRNAEPGIDLVEDLFTFPWSFEDNSFDGILFSHFLEHVPHDICLRDDSPKARELATRQDAWYALLSEAWRVCTPGAIIHILSPYAWSQGAVTDPTHRRFITEQTFTHSLKPDPNSPFKYSTGGLHLELVGMQFGISPLFAHLSDNEGALRHALQTQLNVAYEIYGALQVVK